MGIEGALANSEDVGSLTADHLPDHLPAMARAADDLLDRQAIFCQDHDRRIGLFTPQVAVVLQPLGGRQQFGIDRRGADSGPDGSHRFAYRLQEC
jgi:hypothetical protein